MSDSQGPDKNVWPPRRWLESLTLTTKNQTRDAWQPRSWQGCLTAKELTRTTSSSALPIPKKLRRVLFSIQQQEKLLSKHFSWTNLWAAQSRLCCIHFYGVNVKNIELMVCLCSIVLFKYNLPVLILLIDREAWIGFVMFMKEIVR